MKTISTILIVVSMFASTAVLAECPVNLSVEDMTECIMMEGSGDLDYREWALEFYRDSDPDKVAAIREAYSEKERVAARD